MLALPGILWHGFGYITLIILTSLYPVSWSILTDCTKEKDPACNSRGVCQSVSGQYSCNCLPDWTGTHCETNITSSPACMPGYIGSTCNNTICGHGNVRNNKTYYQCYCDRGWGHNSAKASCNLDFDECKAYAGLKLCKNNGTCVNEPGSYSCNCTSPWTGQNCTCHGSCNKPCIDCDGQTDITPVIIGCVIGVLILIILIAAAVYIYKRYVGKDKAMNDNVFNERFQRHPPDTTPEADDNITSSNVSPHNQINVKEANAKNVLP